jgi:hypothetical protein
LLHSEDIFDLCVIDGVRSNNPTSMKVVGLMNTAHANRQVKKNVFITSLEFNINLGEQLPGDGPKSGVAFMDFTSWLKEDYKKAVSLFTDDAAVRNTLLVDWIELSGVDKGVDEWSTVEEDEEGDMTENEIKRRLLEAVELKYHYAGGSARFMFDLSLTQLMQWFEKTVKQVRNWEAFAKGDLADREHKSVNSLMQKFSDTNGMGTVTVAVSEYILLYAYQKVRSVLTAAIAAMALSTGNDALRGWSFELAQLDLISDALKNVDAQGRRTVGADKFRFFVAGWDEVEYDGTLLSVSMFQSAVIWCLKWNQGCFDVAFYHECTLYTIQFTVSKTHTLKLRYVKELVASLRANGVTVEHIVHIGVSNQDLKFNKPDDTNTGPDTRSSATGEKLYSIWIGTSPPMALKDEKSSSCSVERDEIQMYKVRRKKRKLRTSSSSPNNT